MLDLATYLTNGVENIVKGILRVTLKNPKESAFMLKYSMTSREASKKRAASGKNGRHIPPFLIASIIGKKATETELKAWLNELSL